MVCTGGDHYLVVHDRQLRQLLIAARLQCAQRPEHDIEAAFAQGVVQHIVHADLQFQQHFWGLRLQFATGLRQHEFGSGRCCTDTNHPGQPLAHGCGLALGFIQHPLDQLRALTQELPGAGQADPPPDPLEQLGAIGGLQPVDALGQCRLGDMQHFGSTPQVAEFGDFHKVRQVAYLQVDAHRGVTLQVSPRVRAG